MEEQCWTWTRYRDQAGYGKARSNDGRVVSVHRVAYKAFIGPIPDGLELDHLCRNRACYNPTHLEAVTHAENVRRGAHKAKTHCLRGHAYNEENTIVQAKGSRACRACARAANQAHKARRKAAVG